MISGAKALRNRLMLLWALGVLGSSSLCVALSLAKANLGSEEGGNFPGAIEERMAELGKTRPREVRFEETHFASVLKEPLKVQGILTFTPPSRLEKRLTTPYDDRYVADGDQVLYESRAKGVHRTLSLRDHPSLRVFLEGIRAILSGDVATLRRLYAIALEGGKSKWNLILTPMDASAREAIRLIRITGTDDRMTAIEIEEASGDRSITVFAE